MPEFIKKIKRKINDLKAFQWIKCKKNPLSPNPSGTNSLFKKKSCSKLHQKKL